MVRASDACTQTLESGSPLTNEMKRNFPIGLAARLATSLLNSMLGNSSPLPMLRSSNRVVELTCAAGSLSLPTIRLSVGSGMVLHITTLDGQTLTLTSSEPATGVGLPA